MMQDHKRGWRAPS